MELLKKRHQFLMIFLAVVLGLFAAAGCSRPGSPATPSPTVIASVEIATDTPLVVEDTATPLPQPSGVFLVGSPERSPQFFQPVQSVLSDLAAAAGLEMEVLPALEGFDFNTANGVVVVLEPSEALDTSAFPDLQFVLLTALDQPPAENLSLVRLHPDREAFLAGFITTLISPDWRGAGLLPSDGPFGSGLSLAFKNGGGYLCGICANQFAPYTRFPVVGMLPAGSDGSAWQSGLEELEQWVIYTMYVAPAAASSEIYAALAARGLALVGGQTPPQVIRPLWAATVTQEVTQPLRVVFGGALEGQGGQAVDAPLLVTDTQPELLSEGRLRLVEELIPLLENGAVYTLEIPLE